MASKKYPQALGARKDRKDQRDLPLMAVLKPARLPAVVDYEHEMTPVRDQQSRGACVAFATVAMKEHQEKMQRRRKPNLNLSEEFIYDQIRLAGGGAYGRDAVKALATLGVCNELYMPYDGTISDNAPKSFAPTKTALRNAKIYAAGGYARLNGLDDIKASLVANGVCVIGVGWLEGWFRPSQQTANGYPLLTLDGTNVAGGHELAVVGYDDVIGAVKIKNSWSAAWGKGGYAYIKYDALLAQLMDAWTSFDLTNPQINRRKAERLIDAARTK